MYDIENMDRRAVAFAYLFRVANRLQCAMDAELEGLTAKQWYVLLTMGMFDAPPTLKQLARMCDTSHQNTKAIVAKLRDKGFVTIQGDETDGRALRIWPTPLWAEWNARNEAMSDRFIARMYRGLTDAQIASLCASLMHVFENLGDIKEGNDDEQR